MSSSEGTLCSTPSFQTFQLLLRIRPNMTPRSKQPFWKFNESPIVVLSCVKQKMTFHSTLQEIINCCYTVGGGKQIQSDHPLPPPPFIIISVGSDLNLTAQELHGKR
ncbi:hypothetical protein CEXT_515291 [Caerostris extrusa]|uniref:Uncharacterized protein n=1 Tax=Caerostris extrusa TaxID=172846 RepID=A0AAV4NZI7_CAEEX|nr:hypothetical protein CEXT_515291 [Caerostris extrusa]